MNKIIVFYCPIVENSLLCYQKEMGVQTKRKTTRKQETFQAKLKTFQLNKILGAVVFHKMIIFSKIDMTFVYQMIWFFWDRYKGQEKIKWEKITVSCVSSCRWEKMYLKNNCVRSCKRTFSHLHMCRLPDLPTISGVVQPPHERPNEFYASREQFAEIRQNYEEQRDANEGVYYCQALACLCRRVQVAVT